MTEPGCSYLYYLNDKLMESIDSSLDSSMAEINLLNEHLQAWCKEITIQINRYDYYIRKQLEKTIKNYKLCVELCEEKLDLLDLYKDYKTVLATLSAEKKDLSTTIKIINDTRTSRIMVSERDLHEQ